MNDFMHATVNVFTFTAVTGGLVLYVGIVVLAGNLGFQYIADVLGIPSSMPEQEPDSQESAVDVPWVLETETSRTVATGLAAPNS